MLRGTRSHGSEQKGIMVQKSPGLRAKVPWAPLLSLPLNLGDVVRITSSLCACFLICKLEIIVSASWVCCERRVK